MGAESLRMSYDDMEAEIAKLQSLAEEFESTTRSMTSSVAILCDGWVSQSSETYRQDYTTLANNFTQTLEVVRELIQSTSKYIADMQAVDSAYSQSKVSLV